MPAPPRATPPSLSALALASGKGTTALPRGSYRDRGPRGSRARLARSLPASGFLLLLCIARFAELLWPPPHAAPLSPLAPTSSFRSLRSELGHQTQSYFPAIIPASGCRRWSPGVTGDTPKARAWKVETGRRAGILEGGGMADAAAMKVIKTTAGRGFAPELGNLEESQRQERARVASHPAASQQPSAQSSSGPEGHQKFRSPGKPNTHSRGPEGSRKSRPATSRATERTVLRGPKAPP